MRLGQVQHSGRAHTAWPGIAQWSSTCTDWCRLYSIVVQLHTTAAQFDTRRYRNGGLGWFGPRAQPALWGGGVVGQHALHACCSAQPNMHIHFHEDSKGASSDSNLQSTLLLHGHIILHVMRGMVHISLPCRTWTCFSGFVADKASPDCWL